MLVNNNNKVSKTAALVPARGEGHDNEEAEAFLLVPTITRLYLESTGLYSWNHTPWRERLVQHGAADGGTSCQP